MGSGSPSFPEALSAWIGVQVWFDEVLGDHLGVVASDHPTVFGLDDADPVASPNSSAAERHVAVGRDALGLGISPSSVVI